jgi:serine phosphatase RsbU (regulator of sigma subunit)
MWNKLLERQLRRYIKTADVTGPEFQDLFAAISQAYTHQEEDRQLVERSLDLSSQELTDANRALREASRMIELRNQEMIASLEYARLVQNSLLAKESSIAEVFDESFIFNRPREIVGGDFFWVREEAGQVFLGVADCTGHGVPGAFMSVIGFRLLNQAVRDFHLRQTDQILAFLNEEIKIALSGTVGDPEHKDAMDISLVKIDQEKRRIQFSGLGQRIIICGQDSITEIKGDRAHIGQNLVLAERPISTQDFTYQSGDVLYMFSDGVTDQFGGPDSKKFGIEKLKNLLYMHGEKSLSAQKEAFEKSFDDWKGNLSQIDDVMLLGIRLDVNS